MLVQMDVSYHQWLPHIKGRIKVIFRLFQDRFIKEMRLAKIKTYAQTNFGKVPVPESGRGCMIEDWLGNLERNGFLRHENR